MTDLDAKALERAACECGGTPTETKALIFDLWKYHCARCDRATAWFEVKRDAIAAWNRVAAKGEGHE